MAVIQYNNVTPIGSLTWADTTMTSSKEGYLVKASTDFGVVLAGAGETVLGVIPDSNLYANGDPIPVIGTPGQIVQVVAGSAGFAADDLIKSDASGLGVTAGATDAYFAQALETATSGNKGAVVIRSGGHLAASVSWTRSSTTIKPTTSGDTVATGTKASEAAVIEMTANVIDAVGTGTNINLELHAKGTGVVTMTNGSLTDIPVLTGWAATQATTGTAGTAGQVACVGMTSSGVVIATAAEDPGTALVISDVVAGTDLFTVYTKNTSTDARAALSGKKVNYIVISY